MGKYYEAVQYKDSYQSNSYGEVQVIGRATRKLKVRFLETGNEYWFLAYNVVNGKIRDAKRAKAKREWDSFEEHFTNNRGQEFSAYKKLGKNIRVVFKDTGTSMVVNIDNARAGKVSDPYFVSVYGVGYLGEFDKSVEYWRQAKQLWQNMMKRCYSDKDLRGYLGKCFVSKRWLSFENFLEDIKSLDGFSMWLSGQDGFSTKYNLDKDTIKAGNNIYSKDLCRFITEFENKSLGKLGKTRKDWE